MSFAPLLRLLVKLGVREMENERRCRACGKPLKRKSREKASDWQARRSCGRKCHVGWKNAKPIWQAFADMLELQESGCMEWTGHRDPKGYGRYSSHSGEVLAHRLAYIMHYGPVGSKHVLHRCDNPSCCNPQHLFLGSNQDNMDDKVAKGRSVRLYGRKNPNWRHGRNCKREIAAAKKERGL